MHTTTEIATDGLPTQDKLGLWNEAVWRNIGGLRSESFGEADFEGRMVSTRVGDMNLCRLEVSSHRVVRTPELIRRSDEGFLKVLAQLHGRACIQQAGREVWLSPGEWCVYDTTRAYAVTNPVRVEQLVFVIPKRRLPEPAWSVPPALHCFSGGRGLGRLAWEAMLTLYQELPAMQAQAADGMAEVLTRLVQMNLAELQGSQTHLSQREALRDRIVHHVAQHLNDPRLSVSDIGRALNCSRRHLYNACSEELGGLAGYILRQRTAQAMRLLEDPRQAGRNLTDMALECGFSRPSQMTQAFRAQYGCTPSVWRARSRRAAPVT